MEQSFERMLIEHCAPTLRNMKPANLFRYSPEANEQIKDIICAWNSELRKYGVSLIVLKSCPVSGDILLYAFRPFWLKKIMMNSRVREFMIKEGYPDTADIPALLEELSGRLCLGREFPHEIGIFLGYPLEDVIGFIENKGENYTYSGYWKSYGDPEAAMACGNRYLQCMRSCLQKFEQGISIIQLVSSAA